MWQDKDQGFRLRPYIEEEQAKEPGRASASESRDVPTAEASQPSTDAPVTNPPNGRAIYPNPFTEDDAQRQSEHSDALDGGRTAQGVAANTLSDVHANGNTNTGTTSTTSHVCLVPQCIVLISKYPYFLSLKECLSRYRFAFLIVFAFTCVCNYKTSVTYSFLSLILFWI